MDATSGSDDEKLRAYSRIELDSLGSVIDYAERMIYREGQQHPYLSLRRSAYGKTVVVDTERLGRQEFRLSQTAAVITPNTCGYATPHSPVGRLCSFARPGTTGESAVWGDWEVKEIRLFERFDGVHFEEHVRNFLRMRVLDGEIDATCEDLKSVVRRPPERRQTVEPIAQVQPGVETTGFVITDEEETVLDLADLDEDDDELEAGDTAQFDYFGLSETFYVNQTLEQNQIIARSPLGAMFVEGVAGSGKTSAALGRTKMLCDYDASNVVSEKEFRDVLGTDAAYWDGRFAGQFSQEGSIGFVRTGELIQYLKETCRRIDLPNLPVVEYRELQIRLREHRGLAGNSAGRGWEGAAVGRQSIADTTMAWLRAADVTIATQLAARLRASIPAHTDILQGFESSQLPVAQRVVDKSLEALTAALDELSGELQRESGKEFRLDRIVVRLRERATRLRKEVLGKDVYWLFLGEKTYSDISESNLALQLIRDLAELYDRAGARFVWIGEKGPLDQRLQFIGSNGDVIDWSERLASQLREGEVLVRSGEVTTKGRVANVDDLYLLLLAGASEKAYRNKEGTLVPLRVDRGLGRVKLTLKAPEVEEDEEESMDGGSVAPILVRKKSVDARLWPLLSRRIMAPVRDMGGLYEAALSNNTNHFPDTALAAQIADGLRARKLTDADVDILLCLFQIAGRSFKGRPGQLSEPPFYQSVFIDEVQDFTEQQVFLMAEQARPEYRAITVVGDMAQKLHNGTSIDVRACLPRGRLDYVKLSENLRQANAPGLALFSACLRDTIRNENSIDERLVAAAVTAGSAIVGPVFAVCRTEADLDRRVVDELRGLKPTQTAVVVFPTRGAADEAFARLEPALRTSMINADISSHVDLSKRFVRHFSTIENTKGLEFDVVLLPSLDDYDLSSDRDRNRLYVGVSRAKQRLVLLASRPELQPVLADTVAKYSALLGDPTHASGWSA